MAELKVIGKNDGWHTNDGSKSMHFFIGNKSACGLTKTKDYTHDNDPSKYCAPCVSNRNNFLKVEGT